MKPGVLWNNDLTRDFVRDLKSFAMSLDHYEIIFDLEDSKNDEKNLEIENGKYKLTLFQTQNSFKCPACENASFQVMKGEFQNKPALGLVCLECESYGAVFPDGI